MNITDVQRNAIGIQWQPPADDGGSPITGYVVEKREAKRNLWTKVAKVAASTTELLVDMLTEDTEYHFRVSTENKLGTSEPLETLSATMAKSPFGKHILRDIIKVVLLI